MTLGGLRNPWFPFTRKKHISKIKPGDVVVYDNMLYLVTNTEYTVINKIEAFEISKSLYLNTVYIKSDYINSSESYYKVLLSTNKLRNLLKSIYDALISPIYVKSDTQKYIFLSKTKHECNLIQYFDDGVAVVLGVTYNKQYSLKIDTNITLSARNETAKRKDRIKLMLLYLDNASK